MENFIYALALFGAGFMALTFIMIFSELFQWIKERIIRITSDYKFKKRMKIKPIAKCYCGNCKFNEDGICWNGKTVEQLHVADNWFCSWGEKYG